MGRCCSVVWAQSPAYLMELLQFPAFRSTSCELRAMLQTQRPGPYLCTPDPRCTRPWAALISTGETVPGAGEGGSGEQVVWRVEASKPGKQQVSPLPSKVKWVARFLRGILKPSWLRKLIVLLKALESFCPHL